MAAVKSRSIDIDPQVEAMNSFPVRPSLLDFMINKYNADQHDSANPFSMRVILCGPSPDLTGNNAQPDSIFLSDTSNRTRPLAILETLSNDACADADAANPYLHEERKMIEGRINGIVMDYGECFVHVLEGYEAHVYKYLEALAKDKTISEKAIILFIDDDVQTVLPAGWIFTNKIPTDISDVHVHEQLTDDEMADVVAQDVHRLVGFANEAKRYAASTVAGASPIEHSARYSMHADNGLGDSMRRSFPKLFPLYTTISMYMKSGMFLSLGEFVDEFSAFPMLTADEEIVYPAEEIFDD